jgi:hypothetical protein
LLLKIKISVLSIEFYKILRRKLKATNMGEKKMFSGFDRVFFVFLKDGTSKLSKVVTKQSNGRRKNRTLES